MSFVQMYGGARLGDNERVKNDYYPSPPLSTFALVQNGEVPKVIWEPAAGRGWMSWELERCGRSVFSSDIVEYPNPLVNVNVGLDYLTTKKISSFHDVGVVTNPPYGKNMAEKFILRTLDDNGYKYCAMLCRLTFAESERRRELFSKKFPPTQVMVFSSRFSCDERYFETNPLGGMVAFAWWVWDYRHGKSTETKMTWI